MAYSIVITKEAKRDIDKLDPVVRKRLGKKLLHVSALDDIATVAKALTNFTHGRYRLRIGDFRVLFDIERHTLILLRVPHRSEVYR